MWYHEHIGGESCPIVDTWWQTETGGHMITPLPGVTTTKPGSATHPIPGVFAEVVDDSGNPVAAGGGYLTITRPWPAMLRGIWGDPERYRQTYWSEHLRGPLLRRRRRQGRRRRLPLAARPRRRRHERVRPPHLHHRDRVGARRPPGGRRGRRGRRQRRHHRPGDHRVRDPARRLRRARPSSARRSASTSPPSSGPIARPQGGVRGPRPAQDPLGQDHASPAPRRRRGSQDLGDTTTLADASVVDALRASAE